MADPASLVPVAAVPGSTMAGMYAEFLRREGIQTMVQPQGPGYGGWGAAGSLPHTIFVTSGAYESAYAMLDAAFGSEYLIP